MYVNPVLLGVLSTIFVELVACIAFAFMAAGKKGGK